MPRFPHYCGLSIIFQRVLRKLWDRFKINAIGDQNHSSNVEFSTLFLTFSKSSDLEDVTVLSSDLTNVQLLKGKQDFNFIISIVFPNFRSCFLAPFNLTGSK